MIGGDQQRAALTPHRNGNPAQAGVHGGTLSCRHGFAEVAPGTLMLSAVKPAEDGDGWILRLSNPTAKAIKGTVRFARRPASVELVTLEEIGGKSLKISGGRLSVTVDPKKIVTLRVRLA